MFAGGSAGRGGRTSSGTAMLTLRRPSCPGSGGGPSPPGSGPPLGSVTLSLCRLPVVAMILPSVAALDA
jgi:hypothetical protein